jgi:hypothetical protein
VFVCLADRFEFAGGHSLLCLTRDKERTYEVMERITARKQEQLLSLMHSLPEAQMLEVFLVHPKLFFDLESFFDFQIVGFVI